MTVNELRETLTKLVELLQAADAKASTTKGLNEFIESMAAFDDLNLKAFIKLAEAGKNPPTPRPRAAAKPKADPGEIASEVKTLYERAADPSVTEEHVREVCGRLTSLTKDALVKVADSIDLGGMKSKKKDEIVTEVTNRLLDRKGATIRRQLINRPTDSSATHQPTVVDGVGRESVSAI